VIGMLVTHVLVHGRLQSVDRGVEVWFAARRTGVWNRITMFGADMAETQTAIAVTVGRGAVATLTPGTVV
jgi:hypothetical protein